MTEDNLNNAVIKLGAQLAATSGGATASLPAGWHLAASTSSRVGIDAVGVWGDYSGKGVSVGVFDDGIGAGATETYGKHGTAVAGIIAGRSSTGATGIAYDAQVTDVQVIGLTMTQITARMATQSKYDIVNHSWGWSTPFLADGASSTFKSFVATLADAVEDGRGGLGTLINVAAGNYRADGYDANASNFSNDRHVITVGAVTSEGGLTSYASTGASVLISAPSGGGKAGGILTSDLPGTAGYASGSLTSTFSGTSAATPQVSGVEALMLEANASLGWRDVKTILALSSQQLSIGNGVVNGATDWNGGGLRFSNDIGFGVLDARAAVRLAETWLKSSTSANEASTSGTMSKAVTLADLKTAEFKIDIAAGIDVETITLSLDAYHGRASDLRIELVSPSGTVSTLLAGKNADKALSDWTFSSNAFLGENSGGTWTVRISDGTAGMTGIVNAAKLSVFGAESSADDTYVFTESFSKTGTGEVVIKDAAGFDAINASAVIGDIVLDLRAGHVSAIDGRSVKIADGVAIEAGFGGDGNDRITGNDAANLLWGGRGDDSIAGGGGDDVIIAGEGRNIVDGGAGSDTLRLAGVKDAWTVTAKDGTIHLVAKAGGTVDDATHVERLMFEDAILAFDVDGTAGQGFRLYQAAFDRAPDLQGLAYWVRQLDKGTDAQSVAASLVQSAEFRSLYAGATSNTAFVTELYGNVQNRAPDQAGLAYWVDALDKGALSRAGVLLAFADSAETVAHVSEHVKGGILLGSDYLMF